MTSTLFDVAIVNGRIVDPESGRDGPGNIGVIGEAQTGR